MNFSSLRVRLTAWYFVSLALILTLFAAGTWIAMNKSITEAVDHDLRQRIRDVREFTREQLDESPGELVEEFHEHSQLGLGGGLVQISDGNGHVLFRAARLAVAAGGKQLDFQPASAALDTIQYTTQRAGRADVRVASERIQVKDRIFTVHVAEPMHEFQESLDRFKDLLMILAPVSLVLASLGGFWISSRALSPVDRITHDARQISIANLSARLQVPPARDELQRLTQTLNEMLDRIDTAVRRIVQFTADASHELRAPLTLIHTAAEFSLRRERTREELVEAMRKIVRESARTSRLVDDLLLLARADSGTDEMRLTPANLTATGMDAAGQAMTLAEPKSIRVVTEIPDEPVMVNGDERALARLWLILLDNAVKYTNEGGQITFAIHARNSHAEALVADNGIGIAPAELPHVYDRFWRADKVRSRSLGGAGLGLSIARWIVQRHGGEIQITSEPGRGSQVLVRLPLSE